MSKFSIMLSHIKMSKFSREITYNRTKNTLILHLGTGWDCLRTLRDSTTLAGVFVLLLIELVVTLTINVHRFILSFGACPFGPAILTWLTCLHRNQSFVLVFLQLFTALLYFERT